MKKKKISFVFIFYKIIEQKEEKKNSVIFTNMKRK